MVVWYMLMIHYNDSFTQSKESSVTPGQNRKIQAKHFSSASESQLLFSLYNAHSHASPLLLILAFEYFSCEP